MEERPLADPGPASDAQLVFVVALEDGVVTDVDILVEKYILRVKDERPRLDHHRVRTAAQKLSLYFTGAVTARRWTRHAQARPSSVLKPHRQLQPDRRLTI